MSKVVSDSCVSLEDIPLFKTLLGEPPKRNLWVPFFFFVLLFFCVLAWRSSCSTLSTWLFCSIVLHPIVWLMTMMCNWVQPEIRETLGQVLQERSFLVSIQTTRCSNMGIMVNRIVLNWSANTQQNFLEFTSTNIRTSIRRQMEVVSGDKSGFVFAVFLSWCVLVAST